MLCDAAWPLLFTVNELQALHRNNMAYPPRSRCVTLPHQNYNYLFGRTAAAQPPAIK